MIPVADSPSGDHDTAHSSIKTKQITMAAQNQIIVEIEEEKAKTTSGAAQGNVLHHHLCVVDLQDYYASLANEGGETPVQAVEEQVVIGYLTVYILFNHFCVGSRRKSLIKTKSQMKKKSLRRYNKHLA
jgi:hypothetical protein